MTQITVIDLGAHIQGFSNTPPDVQALLLRMQRQLQNAEANAAAWEERIERRVQARVALAKAEMHDALLAANNRAVEAEQLLVEAQARTQALEAELTKVKEESSQMGIRYAEELAAVRAQGAATLAAAQSEHTLDMTETQAHHTVFLASLCDEHAAALAKGETKAASEAQLRDRAEKSAAATREVERAQRVTIARIQEQVQRQEKELKAFREDELIWIIMVCSGILGAGVAMMAKSGHSAPGRVLGGALCAGVISQLARKFLGGPSDTYVFEGFFRGGLGELSFTLDLMTRGLGKGTSEWRMPFTIDFPKLRKP